MATLDTVNALIIIEVYPVKNIAFQQLFIFRHHTNTINRFASLRRRWTFQGSKPASPLPPSKYHTINILDTVNASHLVFFSVPFGNSELCNFLYLAFKKLSKAYLASDAKKYSISLSEPAVWNSNCSSILRPWLLPRNPLWSEEQKYRII